MQIMEIFHPIVIIDCPNINGINQINRKTEEFEFKRDNDKETTF